MLTPADQAAMRQAVATHDSSLCPGFYRDALLQACCRDGEARCLARRFPPQPAPGWGRIFVALMM